MRKNLWQFLALCLGISVLASAAFAKVWLLPDYQERQLYSRRVNDTDRPLISQKVDCHTYGLISAAEIGEGETCSTQTQIMGITCYGSCTCASSYIETENSCRLEGKIPGGSACKGEYYTECLCDTSLYPYTSSSCAYTLSGASCSDEKGKHYADCIDPCEGLVDNETELGCDKYYAECPSKCEVGKTCVPNDCSGYTLTSCPMRGNCKKCTIGCGNNTSKYSLISCSGGYKVYNNTCLCIYGVTDECSYSSYSYPYSKKYGLKNDGKGFFALEEKYGLKCINAGEDIGEICTINCPSGYGLLVPFLGGEYKCISCTVKNISDYERAKNSCERVILASNFDGQQPDSEHNSIGGCGFSFSSNAGALEGGHCSYAGKPVHVTASSNLNNLNFINLQLGPRDTISDITLTGTPFRVFTSIKSSKSPYKDEIIYIRNLNINSPFSGVASYNEFFDLYGNTILENINLTSTSDGGCCMFGDRDYNISVKNSSFIQKGQSGSACMNLNPLIEGEVNFLGWAYDACDYNLAENSVLNLSIEIRQGNFNLETNATVNIKTEENYSDKFYLKRLARFNINTENVTARVIHVEKDAMIMIPSGLYRAEKDIYVSYGNKASLKSFVEEYLLRIGDYDESVFPQQL